MTDGVGSQKRNAVRPKLEDLISTLADLQHEVFPELKWIVPRYLPEGLSILAGKPKVGKSWLGLYIGLKVATGGECLGAICSQGDVLGLFLEDNKRRMQRRITAMIGANKQDWPKSFIYATQWPRLNEGGLDLVTQWIETATNPRLIIIDILEKVRPKKGKDQQLYSVDYDALNGLQQLAAKKEVSILIIHHLRKAAAEDFVDTLNATLGLAGSADNVIVMGKDELGKYLQGKGRDLDDFSIAIEQDKESCMWYNRGGRIEETVGTPERAAIVKVLTENGGTMTINEICQAVHGKQGNIRFLLHKLEVDGVIEKVARGVYRAKKASQKEDYGDLI